MDSFASNSQTTKRGRSSPTYDHGSGSDDHAEVDPPSSGSGEVQQRKKAGRKQVNTKAVDKRTAQNRIAQRAFRDRKLNYVKDLEQKLEELTAIVAGNPVLTSSAELKALTVRVAQLESENEMLKQTHLDPSFGFDSNSNPSPCASCALERTKAADAASRNAAVTSECNSLKSQLAQLQFESNNTRLWMSMQQQMNSDNLSMSFPTSLGQCPMPSLTPFATVLSPTSVSAPFQSLSIPSAPPKREWGSVDVPNSFSSQLQSAVPSSSYDPMDFNFAFQKQAADSASPRSEDWYDVQRNEKLVPAVELFGPLHVESHRFQLKRIQSLMNSKYVDEAMDILVALSKCSSRKANKKLMVRFAAVKNKLLDSSLILERQQVIEAFEEFKTKHKQHMNHFYQNLLIDRPESHHNKPISDAQAKILDTLKPFKDAVKTIPSLKESGDVIDEMCWQFSIQSLDKDTEEREDRYIYLLGMMGQVQALCRTDEDRTKFMLAMEIARERTRKFADDYALDESKIQ
ncbi:hypothetical protein HDU98_007464 [Podochytrium sp. JEL0797]|nr:hypothetical protein HDU98_007464 [Podochytrium sp. JEL0797]